MANLDLKWGSCFAIDSGTKTTDFKISHTKYAEKIEGFVKSIYFSLFCNRNDVQDGSVIQITAARENVFYKLCDEFFLEDFRINVKPAEGINFYKAKKFISKPSVFEKEIFCAVSYYVCQTTFGEWTAVPLLKDEEWLDLAMVNVAFGKLSHINGYVLSKTIMAESGQAKAWKAEAVAKNGKIREILCFLDNGRIVDMPAGEKEMTPCSLEQGRVIKTKFNMFRCESGRLLRI